MTSRLALPAFTAYGIELEYAIVDAATADVAPLAEPLLAFLQDGRSHPSSLTGWSNELVAHVVEIKNPEPAPSLRLLPDAFQREVQVANRALQACGGRLMPSGMHPWMDPRRETTLWKASDAAIYRTYDRLFDCRRHGWANVQSMHINLPFADDTQFARLHTAIRLVLPLIPALAASSPFADGAATGHRDHRLALYATHMSRFPAIAGDIVPDVVRSRREYERKVLLPMYDAVADADPEGVLRHEWLNARGAIARFERSAIEIRLADVQECPRADMAIAEAVCAVVQSLYEERRSSADQQARVHTERLARALGDAVRDAEDATVDDVEYLRALGVSALPRRAGAVWRDLLAKDAKLEGGFQEVLSLILAEGTLASRLFRRLGDTPARTQMRDAYIELCDCLEEGRIFR
jgi:gamma-glutamyl:cysteine ligase YbdK (ATP-grasp superfamily)